MIASANIIPALGPPTLPILIFTVNGNLNDSTTFTPMTGWPW